MHFDTKKTLQNNRNYTSRQDAIKKNHNLVRRLDPFNIFFCMQLFFH